MIDKEIEAVVSKNDSNIIIQFVRLGINRGQYFLRIPQEMARAMKLTIDSEIKLTAIIPFIETGEKMHILMEIDKEIEKSSKLSRKEVKIINILYSAMRPLTTSCVAMKSEISWITTKKYLDILYEKGYLVSKKDTNRIFWWLRTEDSDKNDSNNNSKGRERKI